MIDFIEKELKDIPKKYKVRQLPRRTVITGYKLLGIKTTALRNCAKNLVDTIDLNEVPELRPTTYEELTIIGLIIAFKQCDIKDKFQAIEYFISINDNWASNDIMTCSIKCKEEVYFDFLCGLFSKGIWGTRFAITAFMENFLTSDYITRVLNTLSEIDYGNYYVDMAVAWLLADAYAEFKEEVVNYLEESNLPSSIMVKMVIKVRDAKKTNQADTEFINEVLKDILCKRETYLK